MAPKAQPTPADRVTRSKRAPIPDIPLPPRREPPTRKQAVRSIPLDLLLHPSKYLFKPPPSAEFGAVPAPRPRPVPRPITRDKPRTLEEEDSFFVSSRAGWKHPRTYVTRKYS
jgi:hypothetical protein